MSNTAEYMSKAINPCIQCAKDAGISEDKARRCTMAQPWNCPGCPYPLNIDAGVGNEQKDL